MRSGRGRTLLLSSNDKLGRRALIVSDIARGIARDIARDIAIVPVIFLVVLDRKDIRFRKTFSTLRNVLVPFCRGMEWFFESLFSVIFSGASYDWDRPKSGGGVRSIFQVRSVVWSTVELRFRRDTV